MKHSIHKPCIIVPVFNHPEGIQEVCARLTRFAIPCILVDDGSDERCRLVLEKLVSEQTWISMLRLDVNQGKGAAVCAGLEWAYERGFSHALQIDADGQHDMADVPRFIEASELAQDSVVTGTRIADGISAVRHYGRKLTDWLVWLQTLSTSIEDSMCGYRMYPLEPTMALLRHQQVGQRMDFDTDILVRLYWRGIPIRQIVTKVIYREGIPSHFRMFKDNLRIIRMHILLVMGMLIRFPVLFLRKFSRV